MQLHTLPGFGPLWLLSVNQRKVWSPGPSRRPKFQVHGEISNAHAPVVTNMCVTQVLVTIKRCNLEFFSQKLSLASYTRITVQRSICAQQEQLEEQNRVSAEGSCWGRQTHDVFITSQMFQLNVLACKYRNVLNHIPSNKLTWNLQLGKTAANFYLQKKGTICMYYVRNSIIDTNRCF